MKQVEVTVANIDESKIQRSRVALIVGLSLLVVSMGMFIFEQVNIIRPERITHSRNNFAVITSEPIAIVETTLNLSGEDYRKMWKTVKLDNVEPRDTDYAIIGDKEADEYIRKLGEARGYERQVVAKKSRLTSTSGYEVQEQVKIAWENLQQAARNDGVRISLRLSSGHRDAIEQSVIFNQYLRQNAGAVPNEQQIISGSVDNAIQQTLDRVAPPGYSKHHTGYTVDVCDANLNACATRFKNTPGEIWMSKNNYENARGFGFIPSYPPDVENQGPNPEPWEYVWVGQSSLTLEGYMKAFNEA